VRRPGARRLARKAGVQLQLTALDVRDFMGTDPPGDLVTNPPYGVRLARGESFDEQLAESLRALWTSHHRDLSGSRARARHARAPDPRARAVERRLGVRLYTWKPR